MGSQAAEGNQGVVWLSGSVIHLRWPPGRAVTEADVRDVMGRASALCPRRRPMLVDMHWMEGLGYKAREAFAGPWPLTRIAAVVDSPVDQVILIFYLARHRPACPTRFFTSHADATAWLKTPARAAKKPPVPGKGKPHG